MFISNFLANQPTLQGVAGAYAINANDLIEINAAGQLQSAKVSDYSAVSAAGASIVAKTTVAAVSNNGAFLQITSPQQANQITLNLVTNGSVVYAYNYMGVLKGSLTFYGTADIGYGFTQMVLLSNGNIAIIYPTTTSPYNVKYTIINQNLQIVVASTVIGVGGPNPSSMPSTVALSGGGFAVCYAQVSTGMMFAIYSNAGASVYAPTVIAGSATQTSGTARGGGAMLGQLSNGNIVVGIAEGYVSLSTAALAFAIFSPAGAAVVVYTTIVGVVATTAVVGYPPQLSIISGYFCLSCTYLYVAVVSNAGVVQGTPINPTTGGYTSNGGQMTTDGTYFYFLANATVSSAGTLVATITTSGAYTTVFIAISNMAGPMGSNGANNFPTICAGGKIFTSYVPTTVYVTNVLAPLTPYFQTQATIPGALTGFVGYGSYPAAAATPSSSLWITGIDATNVSFQILKFEATSIMGVSQSTVAAGNAGALVSYGQVGAYPCNPVAGAFNKAFDHSAATIIGNKGIMLGNSAYLVGVV